MRRLSLLVVLLPFALPAQTVRDSVISVTTARTARVAPDRAAVFVSVDANAETASEAISRVEAKLESVTDALRGLGSSVESERPLTVSVGPTPSMNGYPSSAVPASSTARAVIRVTVTRMDRLAAAIGAALDAGASNATSPAYESTSSDSVRRERVAEALTAARAEAESVARALGGRLGPLVEATTSALPSFQQPTMLSFDGRFSSPTQAPEVVVMVTAMVRYRLIR
jgi:uncharacterized protein YggE